MKRPETTLFMITSVDGKISSGSGDDLDVDRDWQRISGVKEGLPQYYELEQETGLWSLNTGKVMAKIGINTKTEEPVKIPVNFIIIDNQPHLDQNGIIYLTKWLHHLYLVTANSRHPAGALEIENLTVIKQDGFDMSELLTILKTEYHVDQLTIQSGGSLNGVLLREKLLDYVDIVVAPLLVGGKDTPTLIDGASIVSDRQLGELGVLELTNCTVLEDSFIRLRYKVIG